MTGVWALCLASACLADTAVGAARAALDRGLAWRASRLVAPALAEPARRTPDALLLAAEAAARWRGWEQVRRHLDGQPWLDSLQGGRGRFLLARAHLELGRDTAALQHARLAAVRRVDGPRLVALARAYERAGRRDSAYAAWLAAADSLPLAADWLRLRALPMTADSVQRAALAATLASPVLRDRVPAALARGREAAGDTLGAASAYAAAGRTVDALRLRLAYGPWRTPERRAQQRAALLDEVRRRAGTAEASRAVSLFDLHFREPTAEEQLAIARALRGPGPPERAAAAYAAAFAGGQGTRGDRLGHGDVLLRLRRYDEAAAAYRRVAAPGATGTDAAAASFLEGRALVRGGRVAEGRQALLRTLARHPRDTADAARALLLLADLDTDAGRDDSARVRYRRIAMRYPTAPVAANAAFRAAMIAAARGEWRMASTELDSLARAQRGRDEGLAALYWSGRARAALGDTAEAVRRWREVRDREPGSYYGALAARRLGEAPWAPPPADDDFPDHPDLDEAVARVQLLRELGLTAEAQGAEQQVVALAERSAERLLVAAALFRRVDTGSLAVQLARRARDRGAMADGRLYRLLYPLVHGGVLAAEALERGVDPALMAGLIRQESMFDPVATSRAGARGLMQLMPEVGRETARQLGYPLWDAALLYEPDVNVELGAAHLRDLLARWSRPVEVLAAYNAGGHRVRAWRQRPGADDDELFAERIPFVETRDYVRIVQRNREFYRALYGWP